MTATTTTKKPRKKTDFEPEEVPPPDPKTLKECLQEAGGFPFAARAIRESGLPDEYWCLGEEIRCTGWADRARTIVMTDPRAANRRGTRVDVPKWLLLGHKT